MPTLVFNAVDVRRVVEHSLAAEKQAPFAYTDRLPDEPSVVLVHDEGVYLMSNGTPRDIIDGERSFVAYANGCHPTSDVDWRDTARDLVGDDDIAETLPWARKLKAAIDAGRKTICVTVKGLNFLLEV